MRILTSEDRITAIRIPIDEMSIWGRRVVEKVEKGLTSWFGSQAAKAPVLWVRDVETTIRNLQDRVTELERDRNTLEKELSAVQGIIADHGERMDDVERYCEELDKKTNETMDGVGLKYRMDGWGMEVEDDGS